MYVDVQIDAEYKLEIIPEKASNVDKFELSVAVRWVRSEGYSCSIGFNVQASPKGKLFQRYVDYLDWRSSGS
jgi:hypothetical protein